VTAAAVLAFIGAAFALLGGFGMFAVSALPGVPSALFLMLAVLQLAIGGLLLWGGITTIQGKTNAILVYVCIASIVINVIQVILVLSHGGVGFATYTGFIGNFVVIYLLLRPDSKAWFVAKGGKAVF
jgi:hypothetical protein